MVQSTFPSQKLRGTEHFWTFRCRFAWPAQGIVHLVKSEQNVRGFVAFAAKTTPLHYTIHSTTLHYNYNYDSGLKFKNTTTTTLHYIALHYTNYIALHSTTLHYNYSNNYTCNCNYNYTPLHYTTFNDHTLHYSTLQLQLQLHYSTLITFYYTNYITLHYTTLHYTTLHYFTLYYTTLHFTTLHDTTRDDTTRHYTHTN